MADISYTPTTWADGSEGGTPIDAAKLNNIENGIVDVVQQVNANTSEIAALVDDDSETITTGYEVVKNGNVAIITVNVSGEISLPVGSTPVGMLSAAFTPANRTIGVIELDANKVAQLIVETNGYVSYWANSAMTGYPRGQVVFFV